MHTATTISKPIKRFPLLLSALLTLALAALSACSSPMGLTSTPPITQLTSIYAIVPNTALPISNASAIVQFASNANGVVSPSSTLILPTNFSTFALATDSSSNIYVGGNQVTAAPLIFVYAPGSSGAATPVRTINPVLPNGEGINSMTIDSSGQIYLTTSINESIQILAANASGSVTPIRSILWDNTQFTGGSSIAVDGGGDIYLLGYCHCTVAGLGNPTEFLSTRPPPPATLPQSAPSSDPTPSSASMQTALPLMPLAISSPSSTYQMQTGLTPHRLQSLLQERPATQPRSKPSSATTEASE